MNPLKKVRSGVELGNSVAMENMPLLMVQVDPVAAEKEITIDPPDSMSLPQVINDVQRFPWPLTPTVDYAFTTVCTRHHTCRNQYQEDTTNRQRCSFQFINSSIAYLLSCHICGERNINNHLNHTNLVFNSS